MATQGRDDSGRFDEVFSDQHVLKAFDFETSDDDPYLSVGQVTEALSEHWDIRVSSEAVRTRLEQMVGDGTIGRREFGAGVAYRAHVAPELSSEATGISEERGSADRTDFVGL